MTRKATAILGRGGVKILESFYFPRDMRDYTPVATKVASLKPDFFAIPGFGGTAEKMGLMSKALYDTNWRGSTFVTASPVIKDLVDICARGEAEGLYIPMSDFTILPDPPPLALKIRKAFEQKYGEWREVGPYWTLPLWFYVAALQKAGGFDAAAIDKALAGLEIDTPIGKAKMMKRPDLGNMRYCDTMVTPGLAQLKGSKVIPVASMSIKDAIGEMEKTDGFKGQWE
jgi:ABC-type branched-subunit amino acid transport system substrate-binding protein